MLAANENNALWQALFILFARAEKNSVSCSRTGELVVRLIWALSGWGSRLYSLVGGIAPCSGDNYTVYCLPWGAHWTLISTQLSTLSITFILWHHKKKDQVHICCKALVLKCFLLSHDLLKYMYISIKLYLLQIGCPKISEWDLEIACCHALYCLLMVPWFVYMSSCWVC